jgi:SAM-dependent methyltransferase
MSNLVKSLDAFFLPGRVGKLTELLAPYLKSQEKILDVGAGNGVLTAKLAGALGKNIVAVDKVVPLKTAVPVSRYDGDTLPFKNKSFNVVLLVDVLHHTRQPAALLKEAGRVAGKFILVKDHFWEHWWDKLFLRALDFAGNFTDGVDLPYNFNNWHSWDKLFRDSGLRVVEKKIVRSWSLAFFAKNVIFKLEKV